MTQPYQSILVSSATMLVRSSVSFDQILTANRWSLVLISRDLRMVIALADRISVWGSCFVSRPQDASSVILFQRLFLRWPSANVQCSCAFVLLFAGIGAYGLVSRGSELVWGYSLLRKISGFALLFGRFESLGLVLAMVTIFIVFRARV